MAIQYTIVKQQGPPGSTYEDQDVYYARARAIRKTDTDRLAELIQQMSTVSPADVLAVLYGLRQVMARELAAGSIVCLEGVGTFRIGISSKAADNPKQVRPHNFRPPRLHYKPAPQLKKMLNELEYKRRESTNV